MGIKIVLSLVLLVQAFSLNAAEMHHHHQADADKLKLTQLSENAHFKLNLKNNLDKNPLHKIHSWTLHVETAKGDLVENAKIHVYGGMPAHRHGFSTNPQVATYLGNGNYLVEGIKFTMPGYWEIWFNVRVNKITDKASFGINLADSQVQAGNVTSHFTWSQSEIDMLRYMSIDSLPPLPEDKSNRVANNQAAAELGKKLFFDERLSANQQLSCASCHKPDMFFTDGKALAQGLFKTRRHTPGLLGVAYNSWFFWDGRADSLWAQALQPIENPVEMGSNRAQVVHVIYEDKEYRRVYESLFGALPDLSDKKRFPVQAGPVLDEHARNSWANMSLEDQQIITGIFVNLGKSIAAYERGLLPKASRFDLYVTAIVKRDFAKAEEVFSKEETKGLKVFLSNGNCFICHNGPLLTSFEFKNIALPKVKELGTDKGRYSGVEKVQTDPFNCKGIYNDNKIDTCDELRFIKLSLDETMGTFKIPGLRNVDKTAPYMHDGQFKTLKDVLLHYQKRPITRIGHSDLLPTKISNEDLVNLEAFLKTLTGPLAAEKE